MRRWRRASGRRHAPFSSHRAAGLRCRPRTPGSRLPTERFCPHGDHVDQSAAECGRLVACAGHELMRILTINAGSLSLKAALYEAEAPDRAFFAFAADRIGHPSSRFRIVDNSGRPIMDERAPGLTNHDAALRVFLDWVRHHAGTGAPDAAGHRMVHGGRSHREPERVTPDGLADLHKLVSVDPDHVPQALALIKTASD